MSTVAVSHAKKIIAVLIWANCFLLIEQLEGNSMHTKISKTFMKVFTKILMNISVQNLPYTIVFWQL